MTYDRRGDWIQTWSGRAFWPMDPRPGDVCIEDIAHALSMKCRYGGHCNRFYSVAEHCFWVSCHLPDEYTMDGLLHDASESYLADVPRPVKPYLQGYKTVEEQVEMVIAQRFGVAYPIPAAVKQVDSAMLILERGQLMSPAPMPWAALDVPELEPFELACWSPELAERMFLQRFGVLRSRGLVGQAI